MLVSLFLEIFFVGKTMRYLSEEYNKIADPLGYDILTAKKNLLKTEKGFETTLNVKGLTVTMKLENSEKYKEPRFYVSLKGYGLAYFCPTSSISKENMLIWINHFLSYVYREPDYFGDIKEVVDTLTGRRCCYHD